MAPHIATKMSPPVRATAMMQAANYERVSLDDAFAEVEATAAVNRHREKTRAFAAKAKAVKKHSARCALFADDTVTYKYGGALLKKTRLEVFYHEVQPRHTAVLPH